MTRFFLQMCGIAFGCLLFGYGAYSQGNPLEKYYPGLSRTQGQNIHRVYARKQAEADRMNPRRYLITPNQVVIAQPLYRVLPTSPSLHSNIPVFYTPQGAFIAYPTKTSVPGSSGWTNGNRWRYTRPIGGPGSPYWWAE